MSRQDKSGPYIVWEDYGYEGWCPTSYPDLNSALLSKKDVSNFIITKIVNYEIKEHA